jgi:hypothetical protein
MGASGQGPLVGSYEHSTEYSGAVKGECICIAVKTFKY